MFKKPREWDNYLGYEAENANDIFNASDNGYNALFHRLFPKTVSQPLNRGGHRMDTNDVNGAKSHWFALFSHFAFLFVSAS